MKIIKSLIQISRPINTIFTSVVVFVSIILCLGYFAFDVDVFFAILSAALVAASGNIINDYFDYEIDKINRPNRPIPAGEISRRLALVFYFVFVITALIIASFISTYALLIVLITITILFYYSKFLKSIPLVGNISVAVCTSLAFIFGGIVAKNIEVSIIPAIFAFLINLIREILKDIEDLEGDKRNNLKTIPIKYGIRKAEILIVLFTILLLLFTFLPFINKLYNIEYFILVLFFVNLPLIYFIKNVLSKNYLNQISQQSLHLKVVMLFGLMAIYFGVM